MLISYAIHWTPFLILIAYHVPNWLVTSRQCKTNTASNTYCRSPGKCYNFSHNSFAMCKVLPIMSTCVVPVILH